MVVRIRERFKWSQNGTLMGSSVQSYTKVLDFNLKILLLIFLRSTVLPSFYHNFIVWDVCDEDDLFAMTVSGR